MREQAQFKEIYSLYFTNKMLSASCPSGLTAMDLYVQYNFIEILLALARKIAKKGRLGTFAGTGLVNLSLGEEKSSISEAERERVPYLLASTECCLWVENSNDLFALRRFPLSLSSIPEKSFKRVHVEITGDPQMEFS